MTGIYNVDGTIATTVVPGSSRTGIYAADGSINIVQNDASHTGLYHPCGAFRVNTSGGATTYDPSGAYYSNHIFGSNFVASAGLPSGALGIWDPSTFVSASRIIPNAATAGNPATANILRAPRGFFNSSCSFYGPNNQLTVTDNSAVAPDGSTEASTVTGGAGQGWFIQCASAKSGSTTIIQGQTYTFALSVKSLSGGSLNFKMGDAGTGLVTKTATTSWQRFSVTFTSAFAGGSSFLFQSPDNVIAANFAICDWEVFAGSTDLNTTALSLKPQVLRNRDIQVGFDGSSSVSAGKIIGGTSSIFQLDSPLDVKNYTLLYVAKHNVAYAAGAQYEPMIASTEGGGQTWTNFAVGPVVQSEYGQFIASNSIDGVLNGQGSGLTLTPSNELAGASGAGPFVGAFRFGNGTDASSFINGVKLTSFTRGALAPTSVKDFFVGCLSNSFFTTYDIYYLVLYPRVLSDAEVQAASVYLGTKVAMGTPRTVIIMGSSITSGVGGTPWSVQCGPNLNPKSYGINWAFAGNSLANLLNQENQIDLAFAGSPAQTQVVVFEVGANDLGGGANVPQLLTDYAALCDRQRAKGRKVVVHTAMFRTDGFMNSANRTTFNTAVRTWVGVHCNALADWASDATMGTDTSPNNATFFADTVHPTTAGSAILETYSRAAINSV